MNKYEELIESSRFCAMGYNGACDRCIFCGKSNDKDGECYQQLHKAAANAIESLLEISKRYYDLLEKMPRWMPVTDRFPKKENGTYWICTDTGYQCECRWTNNRFGIGESDDWGWSIADVPQYHKVVAWMFLPEPYEGE